MAQLAHGVTYEKDKNMKKNGVEENKHPGHLVADYELPLESDKRPNRAT